MKFFVFIIIVVFVMFYSIKNDLINVNSKVKEDVESLSESISSNINELKSKASKKNEFEYIIKKNVCNYPIKITRFISNMGTQELASKQLTLNSEEFLKYEKEQKKKYDKQINFLKKIETLCLNNGIDVDIYDTKEVDNGYILFTKININDKLYKLIENDLNSELPNMFSIKVKMKIILDEPTLSEACFDGKLIFPIEKLWQQGNNKCYF